jgi:GNAT superfamily N-acetyltransferase
MADLRIRRLTGAAVLPYLRDLARLRISVFREYPYLYDGHLDYEEQYIRAYTASPTSVFVLVFDTTRVVGVATGLPLCDADPAFAAPFVASGDDPARFFYFGESVLLPAYRGQGLGHRFFDEREAHARALGGFQATTFCAVERPAEHPHRPADYQPHDAFWARRGYVRRPDLLASFSWQDLGEPAESSKPMVFWVRAL